MYAKSMEEGALPAAQIVSYGLTADDYKMCIRDRCCTTDQGMTPRKTATRYRRKYITSSGLWQDWRIFYAHEKKHIRRN